ncbi:transketolase [Propionicicella superfundia]|uniref:transketolase n=1 Tax=Propionicicella superfundia TaxID=348582 RepID=UPI000428208D|nr:transketolase [Propionicicella superfundia]
MTPTVGELKVRAERARLNVLRMLTATRSGHLGGALSAIDIITALYLREMRVDPANPKDPQRDRFLLSAGHKAMGQYAVLAEAGFFPAEVLDTYGTFKSPLPGHPDMYKLPGVEANTGALGHGLPIACGMALGLRLDGSAARVYTVMGDGELPEGSNWEGASIASHHELGNLVAFIDVNGLQISGPTAKVMDMSPIGEKFAAFGWDVYDIDGNDMAQIVGLLESLPRTGAKPSAIVAHTVKAKGLSNLEGTVPSHYWKPTPEDLAAAKAEIEARIADLEGANA